MIVTILSKTDCPSCKRAKEWLASAGIEYAEEVYDDFAERQAMYDRLGLVGTERTVPQITVSHVLNDEPVIVEHIRGYEALTESTLDYRAAFFSQKSG